MELNIGTLMIITIISIILYCNIKCDKEFYHNIKCIKNIDKNKYNHAKYDIYES